MFFQEATILSDEYITVSMIFQGGCHHKRLYGEHSDAGDA